MDRRRKEVREDEVRTVYAGIDDGKEVIRSLGRLKGRRMPALTLSCT
jgi:hypothetical protein